MSHLLRLNLKNVRIIKELQFDEFSQINYFYGHNGSGKTTLLESIYMLSLGRSFRTHLSARLINYDEDELVIFGEFLADNNEHLKIGLSKNAAGKTLLRLNDQSTIALSRLAQLLPMQLIHPESYELLTAGPQSRRHFLDWGVFHVKHEFSGIWGRFNRILKQRNSALFQGAPRAEVAIWDKEFVELAQQIDGWRQAYVTQFNPLLSQLLAVTQFPEPIELIYHTGWGPHVASGAELAALSEGYGRDQAVRHTCLGPHRADLAFKVNGFAAHEVLSRGQQKFLIYLLKLAQVQFLQIETQQSCLFLIDDFAAELDEERRQSLLRILLTMGCQLFLTGLEPNLGHNLPDLPSDDCLRLFHVEHGDVVSVEVV